MSLIEIIADIIRKFFKESADEDTESEPESEPEPLVEDEDPIYTEDGDSEDEIHVNIYTTERLFEDNERISEQMVARYLSNIFSDNDISYKIGYNFDTFDAPTEQAVCGEDSVLDDWREYVKNDAEDEAKDSNILLTHASGGGCAGVGGNVAAAPGRHIDELRFYEKRGDDDWSRNMGAALHEFGHNMALSHDHDKDEEGNQHTGSGWNEDEAWHRTPMNTGDDVTNICGEEIPKREYDKVVQELYFTDCTLEYFEIA